MDGLTSGVRVAEGAMQQSKDIHNTKKTVSINSVILGKKYDISGDLVYISAEKHKDGKMEYIVEHGRLTRPIIQINIKDGFIHCAFGSRFLINSNLVIRTLSWVNYDNA